MARSRIDTVAWDVASPSTARCYRSESTRVESNRSQLAGWLARRPVSQSVSLTVFQCSIVSRDYTAYVTRPFLELIDSATARCGAVAALNTPATSVGTRFAFMSAGFRCARFFEEHIAAIIISTFGEPLISAQAFLRRRSAEIHLERW